MPWRFQHSRGEKCDDDSPRREKAHTREGDAIAAARRRLPMTEVDASATLVGENGPVSFLHVFDGRDQLIAYKHMWHNGAGIKGQCEGCTASIFDADDVSYLNHRRVSFAASKRSWCRSTCSI